MTPAVPERERSVPFPVRLVSQQVTDLDESVKGADMSEGIADTKTRPTSNSAAASVVTPKETQMSESPAVDIARAHLEAWTNHDLDKARRNLAADVQFFSPVHALAGVADYMDSPRGLTQFALQVVPGSLRVLAAMGDERNALIMYEHRTEGGPLGSKVFAAAQTWLLDENRRIKVERIISYSTPERTE